MPHFRSPLRILLRSLTAAAALLLALALLPGVGAATPVPEVHTTRARGVVTVTGSGFPGGVRARITVGRRVVARVKTAPDGTLRAAFRSSVPARTPLRAKAGGVKARTRLGPKALVAAAPKTSGTKTPRTQGPKSPGPTSSPTAPIADPTQTPDPQPPAGAYTVPATIDATGSSDVTAALLGFLAAVPDDAVVAFSPRGRYRIDGTIELRDRHGLTLEGNDSVLFTTVAGAGTRAHLRFVGGSRLVIRQLTIHGANPNAGTPAAFDDAMQYQHAIDLRGVQGAEIDRVHAKAVFGDCFYVGLGLSSELRWSTDVLVHDSSCEGNGRQGVAVTAGRDVRVERSVFRAIGLAVFNIEPNGTGDGAARVSFDNNDVTTARQWFLVIVGQAPVSGVSVSGNRLAGKSMSAHVALEAQGRVRGLELRDNVSDRGEYYNGNGSVIDLHRVDAAVVTANRQPAADGDQVLVRTSDSCDIAVTGNDFAGSVHQVSIAAAACT